MLFADDMALVATSASGLRRVLHAFEGFCSREHLTSSREKTNIVVSDQTWEGYAFRVDGFEFKMVDSFKYLGVPLD